MKLSRFTPYGIETFSGFLDTVRETGAGQPPISLLTDPLFSEIVIGDVETAPPGTFHTRFEAASYLSSVFAGSDLPANIERDVALWTWLAARYFDDLCRKDNSGQLKPGERARWIPEVSNFQRYYRHLLAGPYLIYRAHIDQPARAMALLCGSVTSPGDIAEQLASRQELVSNPTLIQVATDLYVDPATGKAKQGAGGKGGGSARRLADLVNQLDLTWDLYAMVPPGLLALLPKEFDRFRPNAG